MGRCLLLTGSPGVGKTTIIAKVVARLSVRPGGFYTEEIRHSGQRTGFRIVTLDGETGILASVQSRSPHRVGRYGVEVEEFERVGVAAIARALVQADVVIIDEIGKMEMFSAAFKDAVNAVLASPKPLLATITQSLHPWADNLKRRKGVEIWTVTYQNRDVLPERILRWLGSE